MTFDRATPDRTGLVFLQAAAMDQSAGRPMYKPDRTTPTHYQDSSELNSGLSFFIGSFDIAVL
ncbi:MAG: hypothetical protein WD355_02030 [Balneolaceae bacterium]